MVLMVYPSGLADCQGEARVGGGLFEGGAVTGLGDAASTIGSALVGVTFGVAP